jgi:hypothetical protein
MAYDQRELEVRVKHLERIICQLVADRDLFSRGPLGSGWICLNSGLHRSLTPDEDVEHPVDLDCPHYTYDPAWNWAWDVIKLHPGDRNGV